jgi:glycosyltransferase involved in cell wall biosynthesis
MEAMACCIPVVASESAHIPVTAQKTVVVVPPNDQGSLFEAIRNLYSDSELRHSLAKQGREIITQYTWQATANAMCEVYEYAQRSIT